MAKNEELIIILRYFIGGIFSIYGFFAFVQPSKYPLPGVPFEYTSITGLMMVLIGIFVVFYKR